MLMCSHSILLSQAEGTKHSPRMLITPRQIQDNSEEVRTLKAEVATLKNEVLCAELPPFLCMLAAIHLPGALHGKGDI